MPFAALLAAALSGLLGTLFPLLREGIGALLKKPMGERFFGSRFGKIVLAAFDLEKTPDDATQLVAELTEASRRMDAAFSKIREYAELRESGVKRLETQLGRLTLQESELRTTIEGLRQVPLPAAQYFASQVSREHRRSALRDYALFIAGVVVSAVVTVILKHFGLA